MRRRKALSAERSSKPPAPATATGAVAWAAVAASFSISSCRARMRSCWSSVSMRSSGVCGAACGSAGADAGSDAGAGVGRRRRLGRRGSGGQPVRMAASATGAADERTTEHGSRLPRWTHVHRRRADTTAVDADADGRSQAREPHTRRDRASARRSRELGCEETNGPVPAADAAATSYLQRQQQHAVAGRPGVMPPTEVDGGRGRQVGVERTRSAHDPVRVARLTASATLLSGMTPRRAAKRRQ